MLQCKECEFCQIDAEGQVQLRCNPFTNIKEPECLLKWQLLRLDLMTRAYMMTVAEYRKLAPLQEKLYRRMSREMEGKGRRHPGTTGRRQRRTTRNDKTTRDN